MADSLTRRRVKVYMLNPERQWDDRGTGHVSSAYVEHLEGMTLLVRSEADGSLLLESKILPNTAYQKQQDTLIVWSEADNFDLALSFQEKAGCDEIWEKICQVQGKDPSVEVTQDVIDESEDERFDDIPDSTLPVELPNCELSKLEDILTTISNCLPAPVRREKLATVIEKEDYVKKLLDLFHMCEDLDNVDGLHHLYDIFKSIFLLNQNSLLEIMFQDDVIFDVLGVLEYDPSSAKPSKHREYLQKSSQFKEVIPITNQELLHKIHQTYRMQYIQDVILPTPSVFEENMLSSLSSYIFFNKNEIVNMLQNDEVFLTVLFAQLTDDETDDAKRRDLMLFLKEFCTFSQTLQANDREKFFSVLSNLGILSALEIILGLEDEQIKSAAIDIFSFIVEFNPSMVRDFITQEGHTQDDDELLINLVIEQMINDSDPELGGAVQLMGILRLLVDPENMLAAIRRSLVSRECPTLKSNLSVDKQFHYSELQKSKNEFLGFFYKHSMHVLTAPLMANTTAEKPSKDDFQTAQLLSLILELLAFCVEHHTYHMKNYVLSKDLLRRVLVLMKSRHAFLALCSLRFMRKIISMKDDFYNRYITRGCLFAPVVEAFKFNGGRYNLLNSAVIELFEFIRTEDMKVLYTHVVENHYPAFENVEYVQTFKALKQRHDQQQDRLKDAKAGLDNSVPSILRNNRFRRDARTLEEEEEMWFDQDDDFDDGETIVPTPDQLKMKIDSDFDHINKLLESKRTKDVDILDTASPPKTRPASSININIKTSPTANPISSPADSPSSSPPKNGNAKVEKEPSPSTNEVVTHKPGLVGLVDYPDDDDESEDQDESSDLPAAKRPRLST